MSTGAPRTLAEVAPAAGAVVLALAPHPDDFDAVGVSMRFLHERGCAVHVAVCTRGANGVDDADCAPPTRGAKAALREAEQRASCRFFGLEWDRLRFLRLPNDPGGHAAADLANVGVVAALLREVAPALVVLPHGRDPNITHQRVYRLLRLAVPAAGPRVVASGGLAALLNRDPKTTAMRTDVVTPYGQDLAAWKRDLLRHHASQQRRNIRTRGTGFDERILAMDRDTARTAGLEEPYAEAFEFEWAIRV